MNRYRKIISTFGITYENISNRSNGRKLGTKVVDSLLKTAAAQKSQVKFIAYTSVGNADNNTLHLAQVHCITEAAIIKTGIPYSFLRNNWYLENVIGMLAEMQQSIRAGALDIEHSDFEKLLGRPTTPISKAPAEIVSGIRNA